MTLQNAGRKLWEGIERVDGMGQKGFLIGDDGG